MSWSDLPNAIRARLIASPDVTAIVGNRVHYQKVPQTSAYPHVWFNRSSIDGDPCLSGESGMQVDTFMVEIVDEQYNEDLMNAVATALGNFDGPVQAGMVFLTDIDEADDDYLFRSASDEGLFLHAFRVSVHHDGEL